MLPLPTRPAPRRAVRRVVVLALTAVVAVLLAACGGGGPAADPGPAPDRRIRDAVAATRAAGTAAVTVDARVGVAGGFDLTGDGLLTLGPPAAADLTLAVPALGRVRVLSVGGQLYAALPRVASLLSGGRRWLALDAQLLGSSPVGRPLAAAGLSEPARLLDVSAVAPDARVVGPEPVDGVPTTHYAGTLPAAPGVDPVAVDVWITDAGLLRRVVRTPVDGAPVDAAPTDAAPTDGSASGTDVAPTPVPITGDRPVGSSTATVTATGVPATISAPPPEEVGGGAGPLSRFLPSF